MEKEYPFWSVTADDVLQKVQSSRQGLTSIEASRRPSNAPKIKSGFGHDVALFFAQFKNPLTLLLVFAVVLSAFLGEYRESGLIGGILLISALLSFVQERKANHAAEELRKMLQSTSKVLRDGHIIALPVNQIVTGDIISLDAGAMVPADGLLLEEEDLYINESVLTGESYPAEKSTGPLPAETPAARRQNSVFRGTSVISGTALMVAVQTGQNTLLGSIESELGQMEVENAFEKGIRKFGYMLMRIALLMAGLILLANIALGRNPLDSILFALALSVGLAPEMLPAIVTITLSAGANRLAKQKVIVKKLSSIQNLGSIDVLCSDKTGTLTEGLVRIKSYVTPDGLESDTLKRYAFLNAFYESGYPNPMDAAIREQSAMDIAGYEKFDEVPYDFIRKRLSIVVAHEGRHLMITKGAVSSITAVCHQVVLADGRQMPISEYQLKLQEAYAGYSAEGYRTIGISYKDVTDDPLITKEDETDMIFAGFIVLFDPPRKDVATVLEHLKARHVTLKILTGDNTLIARNMAAQVGIPSERVIAGKELDPLTEDALRRKVEEIDIFAETEPFQKERIVRALQLNGHVVGYIGDGINDAPALKSADVGVSVHNAVDVAKESADIILMEKSLEVMNYGIEEGRKTYQNTLKYIFITISANFGNMFSLAGASVLLPFLPQLPSQVLLINILTDAPTLSIASDDVDPEMLEHPRKWDLQLIRRFMIVFGLESSIFDFLTFGFLYWICHLSEAGFRTGWFIESVLTEILIMLIIRTHRSWIKSRVGRALLWTSVLSAVIVLLIPYLPLMHNLGFEPLPWYILLAIISIACIYALFAEITKKILFRKMKY